MFVRVFGFFTYKQLMDISDKELMTSPLAMSLLKPYVICTRAGSESRETSCTAACNIARNRVQCVLIVVLYGLSITGQLGKYRRFIPGFKRATVTGNPT